MHRSKIVLLFLFFCFSSCQNSSSENSNSVDSITEDIALLNLLFFKKERKVELWATNSKNEFSFLKTYSSVRCDNTPIGIFHLNMDHIPLLVLETPNEFYGEKIGEEQFEEIYIVSSIDKNTNRQSIVIKKENLTDLLSHFDEKYKIRTFVFPNDLRGGKAFEPCFGCPHRMAELYSSLELHLKQFIVNSEE